MQRSRVGQKLSDIITLRVVLGILALLVIIPGFNINSNLYGQTPDLVAGGLAMLTTAYAAVRAATRSIVACARQSCLASAQSSPTCTTVGQDSLYMS